MTKKQMYGYLALAAILAVIVEFVLAGYLLLRSQAHCSSLCGDSLNVMITMGWVFGVTFVLLLTGFLFIALNKK